MMKTPVHPTGSPPDQGSTPSRAGRSGFGKYLAGGLAGLVLATGIFYVGTATSDSTVVSAPTVQTSGKSGALDAAAVYRADVQGTVLVESQFSGGQGPFGLGSEQGTALGSGFVVDSQGRILTNYHVVDGASKVSVALNDKKAYDARVVATDPSSDLAVLKIDAPASELHPLPLGDSSKVGVGQPVVAIGNPLGLNGSETQGIVSALGRDIQAPNGFTITGAIQTDAAITNGNSGGPLIDANGRVIGINSQVAPNLTGTGQAEGIGFAVPINTAKDALAQLDGSGKISHPYLGISGVGITPDTASRFAAGEGVAVARVAPGGPADRAGIQGGNQTANLGSRQMITGGDIITAIDGRPVKDMSELQSVISSDKVGQRVTITLQRAQKTLDVPVTLADRPPTAEG
jgi:serine protease Do